MCLDDLISTSLAIFSVLHIDEEKKFDVSFYSFRDKARDNWMLYYEDTALL